MKILLTIHQIEQAGVPNAGYAIHHIGGKSGDFRWEHSEQQAISYIENGLFDYFIKEDSRNLHVKVGVAPEGRKYLKLDTANEIPLSQFQLTPQK